MNPSTLEGSIKKSGLIKVQEEENAIAIGKERKNAKHKGMGLKGDIEKKKGLRDENYASEDKQGNKKSAGSAQHVCHTIERLVFSQISSRSEITLCKLIERSRQLNHVQSIDLAFLQILKSVFINLFSPSLRVTFHLLFFNYNSAHISLIIFITIFDVTNRISFQ